MSDHGSSTWLPTVIGAAVFIVLRITDWVMPKGWHSIWTERHGRPDRRKPEEDE